MRPATLLLLCSPAALRCGAPAAVTITDFATHARDAAEGWPPHSQPYLRSKGGGFGGPTLVAHQGVVLAFFAGHKYNCADSPGQQDILCRRSTTKGNNWTNCGEDYTPCTSRLQNLVEVRFVAPALRPQFCLHYNSGLARP
eukprot:COSAG04_NODE_2514_length_3986_cov_80.266272_3_plen_141_part_00